MCFLKMRLAFEVIVNLHVMRLSLPHSLSFPKKMCLAGILPRSLGSLSSVFSGNPVLRSEAIVNFTCDAASCSLIPKNFSRENAPRRADSSGWSLPLQIFIRTQAREKAKILTKEHCTADVGLFDSQFLPNRGSLL